MKTNLVSVDPLLPTGTVEVHLDSKKNPTYRIVSDVAYDAIPWNDELSRVAKEAECICYGSLAQRCPTSRRTLDQFLTKFSGRFSLYDVNLRKDSYTAEIVVTSLAKANIAKLNSEELPLVASMLGIHGNTVRSFCMQLLEACRLEYVVVTLGSLGAWAASRREGVLYAPPYTVSLGDPLGAGDAFAAAFVVSLLEGRSLAKACEAGNAMGAIVAAQIGATGEITRVEYERFRETHQPVRLADRNALDMSY